VIDPIAAKHIAPEHIPAFQKAAKRWAVWILVRSSNPASRQYIGKPGYVPKRLDCKAKTAKIDRPPHRLAGLVASPEIHPLAFGGRDVLKEWRDFQKYLYVPVPGQPRMYLPAGKPYTIESDRRHVHYGCVIFTRYGLSTDKNFIYGDYDLYAIVSEKDPTNNVFVEETRLHADMPHNRSPELFDVQHFLNRELGVPMILHGTQETYSEHTEDEIVLFWPDGVTITEAKGKAEIAELYKTTFQGRQAHGKGTPTQPHKGQWKRV
jgi:hypothetical protein